MNLSPARLFIYSQFHRKLLVAATSFPFLRVPAAKNRPFLSKREAISGNDTAYFTDRGFLARSVDHLERANPDSHNANRSDSIRDTGRTTPDVISQRLSSPMDLVHAAPVAVTPVPINPPARRTLCVSSGKQMQRRVKSGDYDIRSCDHKSRCPGRWLKILASFRLAWPLRTSLVSRPYSPTGSPSVSGKIRCTVFARCRKRASPHA